MTTTSLTLDADPRAADNRRRILQAAEDLIAERGIEKIRLRDIAKQARVSVGMIQHYFDTRDAVIEEMLSAASFHRVAEWASLASDVDDPLTKLLTLLEHAIVDRQRCVVWLSTTSLASRNLRYKPNVERIYAAWRVKLMEVIAEGMQRGVFASAAPLDEVVDGIMSVIDGLMTAVAIDLTDYSAARNNRIVRRITGLMLGTSLEDVALGT